MGLFSIFKKKSKPMMILSEEDSIKLSKDIFNLLVKCEGDLAQLKNHLSSENMSLKNAKIAELENSFLSIRSKIDAIRNDMKTIVDIETQNKDFISFNDDFYIADKMNRLESLSQSLDELLELTAEKPVASELKGMADFIYGKINLLVDAINNIISDDIHLQGTYSKIAYL